jgi:argininosuccinate lyase
MTESRTPRPKITSTYTVSLSYDRRLYKQDIVASIAHAKTLAKGSIISQAESNSIISGLIKIQDEIEKDAFPWQPELEDIHMNIENRLYETIGDVAGKLHTARSRNDQVAVDMRLFTKEAIEESISLIRNFQSALIDVAEHNSEVILPGYTHMQRAQPVLLAHHLLAYFHMLQRDAERFEECIKRTDVLPLGSGALAGIPYNYDRQFAASELGFSTISQNSMDIVSDRDYIVEYLSHAAICMAHISRLGEEIVLWSTQEFGFINLSDQYVTGSSMMPQKRNPDFAELARGKTGRVYGNLFALLTTIKGLPMTYNRDLQEDKEPLFDTIDTLHSTLEIMTGMIASSTFNKDHMRYAAEDSTVLATDLADYLVNKGMPFREAHGVVVQISEYAVIHNKHFSDMDISEYEKFSKLFQKDVYQVTIERSIETRSIAGGTAPKNVREALSKARDLLSS